MPYKGRVVALALVVLLLMAAALCLLRPATAHTDGQAMAQRLDPALTDAKRLWWGEVETRPA